MRLVGSTQMHTHTHTFLMWNPPVEPLNGWMNKWGAVLWEGGAGRGGAMDKSGDPSLMPSPRRPRPVVSAAAAQPQFPR